MSKDILLKNHVTPKIFKAQNQNEFVLGAYDFYKQKCYLESLYFVRESYWNHDERVIEWMYKLGHDMRVLEMDYKQFFDIIHNKHAYWSEGKYFPHRKKKKRDFISHMWKMNTYRVARSFVRKGHQKKEKKDSWLEISGITRTRRKYSGHWLGHAKKSFKTANKRKHRAFERQMLNSLYWDHLHNRTYQEMCDWWMWD